MILSDLDDFILPSQVCINPLVGTSTSGKPAGGAVRLDLDAPDLSLAYEADAAPVQGVGIIRTKEKEDVKIATISLSDCLACRFNASFAVFCATLTVFACLLISGCVTSAEEVLIQEQSYNKLVDVLSAGSGSVVVTLSPQTVASIAHVLGARLIDTFVFLATMLKSLGVQYVLDASAGGDVALMESGYEFLRRYWSIM